MRLRNLDEFKPLRDYLAAEEAKHKAFLVGCNEDRPMHVAQGMARAITGINELIEGAPVVLEALVEKERRLSQAGK